MKIKAFKTIQLFILDFICTCDDISGYLSGDISLNPGPVYNNESLDSNEWNVFKSKRIHLIHLASLKKLAKSVI